MTADLSALSLVYRGWYIRRLGITKFCHRTRNVITRFQAESPDSAENVIAIWKRRLQKFKENRGLEHFAPEFRRCFMDITSPCFYGRKIYM